MCVYVCVVVAAASSACCCVCVHRMVQETLLEGWSFAPQIIAECMWPLVRARWPCRALRATHQPYCPELLTVATMTTMFGEKPAKKTDAQQREMSVHSKITFLQNVNVSLAHLLIFLFVHISPSFSDFNHLSYSVDSLCCLLSHIVTGTAVSMCLWPGKCLWQETTRDNSNSSTWMDKRCVSTKWSGHEFLVYNQNVF